MTYKRTKEEQQNIMKIWMMFAKSMGVGILVMLAIVAFVKVLRLF